MIPSMDTICSMPTSSFVAMLESLANATTRVEVVDKPINYNQEPEIENDDDPGLPYFPNNPTSLCFYPLFIPHDDNTNEKVITPFIYYRNKGQEVVGCMKWGAPPYVGPVYLHMPNPVQLPIPLTNMQVWQFSADDPHAYTINEVLRHLEDLCINVEVSRMHDKLDQEAKIRKQLEDI